MPPIRILFTPGIMLGRNWYNGKRLTTAVFQPAMFANLSSIGPLNVKGGLFQLQTIALQGYGKKPYQQKVALRLRRYRGYRPAHLSGFRAMGQAVGLAGSL